MSVLRFLYNKHSYCLVTSEVEKDRRRRINKSSSQRVVSAVTFAVGFNSFIQLGLSDSLHSETISVIWGNIYNVLGKIDHHLDHRKVRLG